MRTVIVLTGDVVILLNISFGKPTSSHTFSIQYKSVHRQGAKAAKEILDPTFIDQGNRAAVIVGPRNQIPVIYVDTVDSLQKKPSRPSRLRGSKLSSLFHQSQAELR